MEEKKEVVKVENQVSTQREMNIDNVIAEVALQENGLERLEKLMDLRDRDEAFKAKKSFDKAMSDFQADCPVIKKTKAGAVTKGGQLKFKYADLGMIVSQVKEILSKHGLSYTMKTKILQNGNVKATCIAKHFDGGSDESSLEVPVTKVADHIMTQTQSTASATSFAKRYAFCDVFGILTADEDNLDQMNYADVDEKNPKDLAKIDQCKNFTQLSKLYNSLKPEIQEKYKDDFNAKRESFRDTKKSSEVSDDEIPVINI